MNEHVRFFQGGSETGDPEVFLRSRLHRLRTIMSNPEFKQQYPWRVRRKLRKLYRQGEEMLERAT